MKNLIYINKAGHITVETVGTFVPLVLLMISILSLVNIVTVQARMHYALTQTAITISIYSYALEAAGLSKINSGSNSRQSITEEVDSAFSGIGDMMGSNTSNNGNSTGIMRDIANSVKDSATNQVLDVLIQPLIKTYLTNGDMCGDEYLRRSGIVNMNLVSVELPNKNENVKLTLQYEVHYTFGALPLPFGPTLNITQTAITKGWQNGSGEGYR